jgi:hypothetical protein
MNEAMQETTRATQADFHPENLLTGAMVSGTHPVSAPGGLLNRVWHLFDQAQKGGISTERVHEIVRGLPELRQLVEQYTDPSTGKPRAECADPSNPGVVAMKDETACFGRKCGFASGCFLQCSLGPSHRQDGTPLGVEGQAPAYNTAGQPLGNEQYTGVLKVDAEGNVISPQRHRDNSCITLSMFLRLAGIPPAPTQQLSDALWDILPQALTAVEQGLQAQPQPTPAAAAPAQAPPAPPSAPPAPPQPAAPPQAAPPQPQAAPQPPQAAPQTAPPAQTPAPATPPAGHGLPPIFPGVNLSYDQQCELHALMYALEHSPEKPKGAQAIKNMEKRHAEAKKTPKAILAAWRKPCEDRSLVIGSGTSARLKPEFWPQHIPVPAGYYETEAQASATPQPAPPANVPPAAAPVTPAAPQTVAVKPQAPVNPPQKVDSDQNAPVAPGGNSPVDINTVTLDPESKEALKAHTEAMNNLAAALRGATFQGAGQDGGNSAGTQQAGQPPAQVQQAPQQPAGPPPVYAQQPAPAQQPPAPPPPPTTFRDYGNPVNASGPIVDPGQPTIR